MDVGPKEDVDWGRPEENDGFNKLDTSLMILETGGNKPFPAVELVVVGLGGGGVVVVVVGKRGGTIGRLTKCVSEDNQKGHTNLPSNERTSHRAETRLGKKERSVRLFATEYGDWWTKGKSRSIRFKVHAS